MLFRPRTIVCTFSSILKKNCSKKFCLGVPSSQRTAPYYWQCYISQGQESIFTLRECAQSIFRMILPLYRSKIEKKIFRRMTPKWLPPFNNFHCFFFSEIPLHWTLIGRFLILRLFPLALLIIES